MSTGQESEPRDAAPESAEEPSDETRSDESSEAESSADGDSGEEYLRLLKRERADFANYRRRVDEERAQLVRDASLQLLMRLLPIIDDFELVMKNAGEDDVKSTWGKGVQLVERKLQAFLASEEVHRIEADGTEFNPWEHEAVSYQPSAEVDEGHVAHVIRPGYRKGERVIRPAQVVVAGRP